MTRDLRLLITAESIRGNPIDADSRQYLEQFAKSNGILRVQVGSASSFSKPIQFFRDSQGKFQYLQDGKLIPFENLNGKSFIAFQVKNRVLIVYGYFPGEYKPVCLRHVIIVSETES